MDVEKLEPEPNSNAVEPKAFKLPPRLALPFVIYSMVGLIPFIVAWILYQPARSFEIVPTIVAAFYLLILLAVWSRRSSLVEIMKKDAAGRLFLSALSRAYSSGGLRAAVTSVLLLMMSLLVFGPLALALTGVILVANGALDHAPAETRVLPIVGTGYRTSENGVSYYGVVASPVPPKLGIALDPYEKIPLTKEQFEHAGPDMAQLELHTGFLGIPWFNHPKVVARR